MKSTLSLTKRYLLFLAAVIVVLLLGTLVIVSTVVKDSLTDLMGQRFALAASVLQQYSTVHYYTREAELRAVLTSPRFAAAIETEDSSTIAVEVPQYVDLLSADFLVITDPHGRYLYRSPNIPGRLHASLAGATANTPRGIQMSYVIDGGAIYETCVSEIVGNNGRLLGWIATGTTYGTQLATDLGYLTGFDVIVTVDSQVIGMTPTRLATALASRHAEFTWPRQPGKPFKRSKLDTEEILYTSLQSDFSTARITFAASLDEHIAPLRARVTILLLLLALGGGALAMFAIYLFTARRIGRQVKLLVTAAERIASGDTDFTVVPQSTDELGWLAGEFERMRSQLVANRRALDEAHEQRVASARLAAVGSMATGIIHDFKNPMAVVRGTADLIAVRDPANAKLQKHCTTIHQQVDRMLDLTRDLLEFSRGCTQLTVQPVILTEYFAEILAFHHEAYAQAGLQLVCTGEPVEVTLDPTRFRRVVDNILNNAREALPQNGKVEITWHRDADGVHVRLADNGPGIPPDIAAKLFEPFVTSNKPGGTGLGLAIAKKIVEDHGASIDVISSPAQGAAFCIDFPRHLVAQPNPLLAMKG